ncbi:hypothetical protein [Pseudomonas pisciculturae]|uniref:hypothetical protein n=1 Tax=Pseudomonas pisciculturae TaxID=2730413 RepID=UPI001E4E4A4A|nr:hypothetical protein [Pseudomonas pisciculturae]
MSDNQLITVPRDEVERLVKLLQYQAHPCTSLNMLNTLLRLTELLDKPIPAAHVQHFWSHEAKNIRCVREEDYDTLQQRLDAAYAGLKWESERNKLLLERVNELEADTLPDPTLCSFYDVPDYPGLVRELVGHVGQLQDSAKRNVKPWEDTFPPTLLPAYIERVNIASSAVLPPGEQGACDQDVYSKGKSVCVVDIPKETAEVICRNFSAVTGWKVDWHYIGGRVHMKAMSTNSEQGSGA